MRLVDTSCCAIQEIDGLSSYKGRSKAAMVEFCRLVLRSSVLFRGDRGMPNQLYSFYLFTADTHRAEGGYDYGTDFAAFIIEHGLGTVTASPVVKNLAFHSDHWNQVWVWAPDTTALRAWYENEAPKPRVVAQSSHKPSLNGYWTKAMGVANDADYPCPHCGKIFDLNEKIWYDIVQNRYYCEKGWSGADSKNVGG